MQVANAMLAALFPLARRRKATRNIRERMEPEAAPAYLGFSLAFKSFR